MITNDQDYDALWQLTEEAADRLFSGEGRSGMHYELIALLKNKYGITAMTREESVKFGRRLCDEYVTAQLAEEA